MEKLPKRILIKICSTRPYRWVMRKVMMAMWRRAAKAPEVQERIKALSAIPPNNTQEYFYAHLECNLAVLDELSKLKWVKTHAPPPEIIRLGILIQKIETSNATAGEIEEFQRLAAKVLQHPRCPPEYKQRIEAALASVSRSGGRNEQA